LLLCKALESWRAALQVLVNIPLAAFGSVVTLLLVNRPEWATLAAAPWWEWPRLWVSATSLSVAHWVGFITLIGVVSRNGIMMISHYIHLMKHEGETFSEAMIIRGSLERLAPVMMTAMTSFIGLLPLLFGAGQTGKEILYPLALVVFGGMLTSTILDQLVTPALFFKFGRKVYQRSPHGQGTAALNLSVEEKGIMTKGEVTRNDERIPMKLTEPTHTPLSGDNRSTTRDQPLPLSGQHSDSMNSNPVFARTDCPSGNGSKSGGPECGAELPSDGHHDE